MLFVEIWAHVCISSTSALAVLHRPPHSKESPLIVVEVFNLKVLEARGLDSLLV